MSAGAPNLRDLFYGLGFAVLAVAALSFAAPYLVPIAVAVLIWFLINATAGSLRRHVDGLGDTAALALSVAGLFGVIVLSARIVAGSLGGLTEGLSGVDDRLMEALNASTASIGLDMEIDLAGLTAGLTPERVLRDGLGVAQGIASNIALVFLYVMFLLIDQRYYEAKLQALAPDPARRRWLGRVLYRIAEETRAYLWLMTLISAGVAVSTWLILWVFGVPGAGFWGFLAFGLNFIPTIGSIAAVALPALYALILIPDLSVTLVIVGLLAGVQVIAGEVVLPRVMGDRLNLSTFVILLLLVVWGSIWGPAGMFLAIPITVILMIVFAQFPATRPIALALSKAGHLPDPECSLPGQKPTVLDRERTDA